MNDVKSETVWDDAAQQALRETVRSILSGERISQAAAAKEADVSGSTFNAWLAGTYAGDSVKVAGEIHKWVEARRERTAMKAIVPLAPSFIQTKTAAGMIDLLQYAQTLHDFAVLIGGPGTGKTTAIGFYKATRPSVFVATMEPAKKGTHHLLMELRAVLNLTERSAVDISDGIVRKLRNRDALLVIDEAQHLNSTAIDQLRSIHDKAGCGVVIAGNEQITAKLGDPDRAPQLAQLYSRVGMRMNVVRPLNADIDALLKAWGIEDKDERQFLRLVGNKPGALRALTKLLIAATAMATGAKEERSLAHLRDGWSRVGAGPIGNS